MQQTLQTAFETWGRPDAIRFDNGRPWANPVNRVPTPLALWLVGLGIQLIFGRPRQSTDNAVVERSHGVLNGWVEPEQCQTFDDLQKRLDYFVKLQREQYPVCDGQSRAEIYPDLVQPRRPYRREQDAHLWQRQLIWPYLARFRWARTVDLNGRISVLARDYSVGRRWASQDVTVWFDRESLEWVIENRRGVVIKRLLPVSLDYHTIASLSLRYRQG